MGSALQDSLDASPARLSFPSHLRIPEGQIQDNEGDTRAAGNALQSPHRSGEETGVALCITCAVPPCERSSQAEP